MIGYSIKEALTNFKRAGIMSYASIGIITITIFILCLFLLLTTNLKLINLSLSKKTTIVVYLKDSLTDTQIIEIEKSIAKIKQVRQVAYVSKKEALKRFKEDLKEDKDILNALPGNPLPDYLDVSLTENEQFVWADIEKIVYSIKALQGVDNVDYGQKAISILEKISYLIKLIVIGLGLVLSLATLIIISNTIELGLFARQEEIYIMRLVGATNWFIRVPCLLEGALQGIISGILSLGLLGLLYNLILLKWWKAESFSLFWEIRFLPIEIIGGVIIGSAFLGCLGSFLSIHYFLQSKNR